MTTQKFSKENLEQLRADITEAIAPVAARYGINLSLQKISYTERNFKAKLEGAVIDSSGTVLSADAESFKKYAALYGFKPEDLGREFWFSSDGQKYKIIGFNSKAPRFPIVAERLSDNRVVRFAPEGVLAALLLTDRR